MTRRAAWPAVSLVMVAAILLASCSPAGTEPAGDQTTPETEPAPAVMVEDSLGVLKEKPRYGGVA